MKNCPKCGAIVTDDATVCPKCGDQLGAAAGAGQNAQDQFSQNAQQFVSGLDRTAEYDPADINETKIINIIAYLSILFFLPLVVYPNSRVGRFHANQALIMFIINAIFGALTSMLWNFTWLEGIGFIFRLPAILISSLTGLIFFAAFIFELVNIINNKVVELPLIGKIKLIK